MAEDQLVIAGAGIAGLALAAGLRHAASPWSCVLLEERPALGSTGGAITLWPAALAALDRIGVGGEVRALGHPVGAGSVRTHTGRALRTLDSTRTADALGEPLLAVRRGELIEALHVATGSAVIVYDAPVLGFEHTPGGVRVLTGSGAADAVEGTALVGADGYRSRVARTLQPDLAESYAGFPAWRGLARVDGLDAVQVWGARQEFGVVPLGRGEAYWFATVREPPGGVLAADPADELARLRAAFAGWPDPVLRVLDAAEPATVSRNDVMDRAPLHTWRDGPVVVIGDAAHPMRPHLGQGGCQALLDAATLAEQLSLTPRPEQAFAAFEARRRRTAGRVVRASRAASRAVDAPTAVHRLSALVPDRVFLRALAALAGS
ncbi:MAG TPA: FAD-dependent monooxygenase [Nocardioides sp.]|nr:FAD-dependent monooxygenase [Nocardioides sp.]